MYKFKLGTDPEFAVISNANSKPTCAIGLIGGSKSHPLPTEHGFVQEDGVAIEGNTHPAEDKMMWVTGCQLLMSDMSKILAPLDMRIDVAPSRLFDDDQLIHPKAREAGCEPDFNAWARNMNEKPDLSGTNLRVFGGHLHISSDLFQEPMDRLNFTKCMDLFAGIPSVLMDSDSQRKELYGKAGCHRPKFIRMGHAFDGIEYRTLSNFWLKSETLIGWAYDVTAQAVAAYDSLKDAVPSIVEDIINTNDKKGAEQLVREYDLLVV